MNKIFVTSDLHFCHDKSFLYEPRGFTTIDEHDEAIIKNWNSIVDKDDVVYILGDVMLNNNDLGQIHLFRLNGHKIIIRGNHDTDTRVKLYNTWNNISCDELSYASMLKYGKYHFYLSHYPTKVGNYDDEERHSKLYCLCGHIHTKDRWLDWHDKCYHVELDAHNNFPISIDDIITDIKIKNQTRG